MIAYKFLLPGAKGRFSELSWPMPSGDAPGAWVEAQGPLSPTCHGIHACRARDLPYWIDAELWEIELDGAHVETTTLIVAERGRLVRRVERWNDALRRELAERCAARARQIADEAKRRARPFANLAEEWALDTSNCASYGMAGHAAYISAMAAHVLSDGVPEEAYAKERRDQAEWLAEKLGIAAD